MSVLLIAWYIFSDVGMGDIKYALLCGLVLGYLGIAYAFLVTGISSIAVAYKKQKTPHVRFPYGVLMSAGGIVAILISAFVA